jgi:hypothetical protein
MAVHLLQLSVEPADWARSVMIGKVHRAPEWPESERFALIAVIRNPGPRNEAHTRALWVTTPGEMDHLLTNHEYKILWFTVARHRLKDEMIERTLTAKEHLP